MEKKHTTNHKIATKEQEGFTMKLSDISATQSYDNFIQYQKAGSGKHSDPVDPSSQTKRILNKTQFKRQNIPTTDDELDQLDTANNSFTDACTIDKDGKIDGECQFSAHGT